MASPISRAADLILHAVRVRDGRQLFTAQATAYTWRIGGGDRRRRVIGTFDNQVLRSIWRSAK